jgi:phosphatidylserine decarboxylase precursor
VPWAARRYGIDLAEAEVPPGGFPTFNAFFTRALRRGARSVDPDPKSLVSPADGHLLVLAPLDEEIRLPVKGAATPIAALLGDAALAAAYRGGAAAILRLYVPDCHQVVFPCAGVPDAPRAIPGAYHAVTPRPGNDVPFLARNRRAVSVLVSDAFGALAIVDVGGFLVGSIRHLYAPGVRVEKARRGACSGSAAPPSSCSRPGAGSGSAGTSSPRAPGARRPWCGWARRSAGPMPARTTAPPREPASTPGRAGASWHHMVSPPSTSTQRPSK